MRSFCVLVEIFLFYYEVLCLMVNEKVMVMDCGFCFSFIRRVYR